MKDLIIITLILVNLAGRGLEEVLYHSSTADIICAAEEIVRRCSYLLKCVLLVHHNKQPLLTVDALAEQLINSFRNVLSSSFPSLFPTLMVASLPIMTNPLNQRNWDSANHSNSNWSKQISSKGKAGFRGSKRLESQSRKRTWKYAHTHKHVEVARREGELIAFTI